MNFTPYPKVSDQQREKLIGYTASYQKINYNVGGVSYFVFYENVHDDFNVDLLKISQKLIRWGQCEEAMELNKQYLEIARNWETIARIHMMSGEALIKLGDYESSLKELTLAVELSPPFGSMLGLVTLHIFEAMDKSNMRIIDFEGLHVNYYLVYRGIGRQFQRKYWCDIAEYYYGKSNELLDKIGQEADREIELNEL